MYVYQSVAFKLKMSEHNFTEEYIDPFFNVHEFNPTHADNCNGEQEETRAFRAHARQCGNSIQNVTSPVRSLDRLSL